MRTPRVKPAGSPARRRRSALWTCPKCGESFTTRNQWHACGVFDLEPLFTRSQPHVRRLFQRFVAIARKSGPLTVIPQRSRIALQVRMRFAALTPQVAALRGHLVLARRIESPRFVKVESLSPRSHLHVFRLTSEDQLDGPFRALVAEAYRVGRQDHFGGAG